MNKTLLIVGGLVLGASLHAQELRFVVGEWEPYTGSELTGGGVAVALIDAACRAVGLPYRLEFAPWKRAEAMVASGEAFASFPYVELSDRGDQFLYSAPFLVTRFVVLARTPALAGQVDPEKPSSFRGWRVGFTAGTDVLRAALVPAGAKIEETTVLDSSVRKLEAGRLDFVIDDQAVVSRALLSVYGARSSPFPTLSKPFGPPALLRVMASKGWPQAPQLMERLNQGLTKITRDGTVARLLRGTGLTPP